MAKTFRPNRNVWVHRSNIPIRSFETWQRGYVYWKDELVDGKYQCIWKGKEFLATDWIEMCDIVHGIKEFITEY